MEEHSSNGYPARPGKLKSEITSKPKASCLATVQQSPGKRRKQDPGEHPQAGFLKAAHGSGVMYTTSYRSKSECGTQVRKWAALFMIQGRSMDAGYSVCVPRA